MKAKEREAMRIRVGAAVEREMRLNPGGQTADTVARIVEREIDRVASEHNAECRRCLGLEKKRRKDDE